MKTKLFTLIEVLDLNLSSASENYTTVTELSLVATPINIILTNFIENS